MDGSHNTSTNMRLRQARIARNWRQRDLADHLQTTTLTIRRWEQGSHQPGLYFRAKLCALFGLSAQELGLGETDGSTSTTEEYKTAPGQLSTETPALWTVPYARNPHFTGRDELLDQLAQHLSSEATPGGASTTRQAVLTQTQAIKGLGGIGKTQVALEYAYRARLQGHYTHVFWVNASSKEAIVTSFITLAGLLPNFPEKDETDQGKLVAALKRWLEQCPQRWLLIFDNADDLALAQEYFPLVGNGSLLLTTRANAVGPHAIALDVEKMGLMEGTMLLLHRAQRLNATDEASNEATNIVIALDGFPLALDQAGAYIEETGCSFQTYLQLYQDHRQALLARRGRQTTNYPESVATTWALSFQIVAERNPAAVEFLHLCAFLAPDHIPEALFQDAAACWPPALQQAVGDPFTFNALLEEVLAFSLIKRPIASDAVSLHRLVQAVQQYGMEPHEQQQWAECAVRAVHTVFPAHPKEEVALWPKCLRYLEQVQACDTLVQTYALSLPEAVGLFDRAGLYLYEQSSYTLAKSLFQRALFLWERLEKPDPCEKALLLSHLARLTARQGAAEQAEQIGLLALTLYEELGWAEHPALASLLNDLGGIYHNQGHYEQAEWYYQRALALSERHPESTGLEMARSLDELAGLTHLLGRYEQAETWYQRALALYEHQLDPGHPRVGTCLNNLGNLYVYMEKYEQAAPILERALAIRQKHLGDMHDDVAATLAIMGNLFRAQHRNEQAEHYHQQALAIRELRLGPRHPYTSATLNNLAELAQERGDYARAEHLYQQTLSIRAEQLGPEHADTAYPLHGLATLRLQQGLLAEAETFAVRALAIREHALPPAHPEIGKTLTVLAALREAQGQTQEAVSLYQRALTISERVFGHQHPQTAEIQRCLGAALLVLVQREMNQAKEGQQQE